MKPTIRLRAFLFGSTFLATAALQANTLYWDNNTTTSGFGTAGGTWSSAGSNLWNQDALGATASGGFLTGYVTTTADNLNFGTTANGLAAGTVTVSGTVNSGNITFGSTSGAILLSGGIINLAAAATISTGSTATINSTLSGAGTSLGINGGGTLIFTGGTANFGNGLVATVSGGTTVRFATGGFNGLGGSGGYNINLGNSTSGGTLQFGNSGTLSNAVTVVAGTGTRTLTTNGGMNAIFDGTFAVNENLAINWSGNSGGLTISGTNTKTIAAGKTVTFTNSGTSGSLIDSAVWTGSGAITYTGSNAAGISVSGAKTHSGGSTLGAMSGTGVIAITSSSTGSANAPTDGPLGTGTLSLGATKVRAGISADITIHNPITFTGGPTFATIASEKSLILTGNADLNGSARTLTVETGSTVAGKFVEFQGAISGANGIVKAGAGTLKFSGLNTYAGNTQINTGILLAGADNTIPFGTGKSGVVLNGGASAAGTLDLNGFNLNINGLTGTANTVLGMVVNNATGTNKTLTLGNGNADGNTFSGIIADNTSGTGTIALTKTGTGSQILSGSNTYTGLTTINAGALRITDPGSLGGNAAGTLVNGGTGGTGVARLELSGGITVSGESVNIKGAGNFVGALSSFSGVNEWAGNVTVGVASTRIGATSGATLKVSGVIDSGSNTYGLIVRTGDINSPVVLSAANTYLGDTTIAVGKLQLDGGDNRLPVATKLIMGSTTNLTEFDLNGRNQEVAGLAIASGATGGNNSINNSSASLSTLNVNTATASASTFGGVIKGNLALIKTGSDSLTLSNTNTYTGATTVSGGTLYINGNISTSALTTVQNGATLGGSGGTVGDLTIEAGGYLSPGNSPGTLTVDGDYTQYGTLIAEVSGLNPGTQHDQVLVNGAVSLGGSLSLAFSSFTPANGNLIFILLNDLSDSISGTFTGLSQGAIVGNYGGYDWKISYLADHAGNSFSGGNDVALLAVPEPRAALLIGMAIFAGLRRRRK